MAKKETKEMKDCNAIGDVCKIDGFKSTMVNVERKVFKTIAWTWTGSDSEPCHTKKEAMEIAKEEMFGSPKNNVAKARFVISFSDNFMPCWELDEYIEETTTTKKTTTAKKNVNECTKTSVVCDVDGLNELEHYMECVLDLISEMAYEWNFDFDDAKRCLIAEAYDILDPYYIDGLAEVDSELARKVETCIENIVEEVEAINSHDDIDWDGFNDYDIEDVLEEVRNLITKSTTEEPATEANVNNNYEIIREFLELNGVGTEYIDKNGDTRVDRSRTLDIEGFLTVTYRDEEMMLSYPTVIYSVANGKEEFVFNAVCATGGVSGIEVDDMCAEIFAEAIKNGDIEPLLIKKLDEDE